MIRIDGCESVIFPDGSVRINSADGRYLCLDYSDIKILYNFPKFLLPNLRPCKNQT
jgi:hypothetical protein